MIKTSVTGKVVPVSRWINTGNNLWVCEHCGGGSHKWSGEDGSPQPIICPECNAIMIDKGAIGG